MAYNMNLIPDRFVSSFKTHECAIGERSWIRDVSQDTDFDYKTITKKLQLQLQYNYNYNYNYKKNYKKNYKTQFWRTTEYYRCRYSGCNPWTNIGIVFHDKSDTSVLVVWGYTWAVWSSWLVWGYVNWSGAVISPTSLAKRVQSTPKCTRWGQFNQNSSQLKKKYNLDPLLVSLQIKYCLRVYGNGLGAREGFGATRVVWGYVTTWIVWGYRCLLLICFSVHIWVVLGVGAWAVLQRACSCVRVWLFASVRVVLLPVWIVKILMSKYFYSAPVSDRNHKYPRWSFPVPRNRLSIFRWPPSYPIPRRTHARPLLPNLNLLMFLGSI